MLVFGAHIRAFEFAGDEHTHHAITFGKLVLGGEHLLRQIRVRIEHEVAAKRTFVVAHP